MTKGINAKSAGRYIHLASAEFVLTVIFLNVPGVTVGDKDILDVFVQQAPEFSLQTAGEGKISPRRLFAAIPDAFRKPGNGGGLRVLC
jgi:hypothetical protein